MTTLKLSDKTIEVPMALSFSDTKVVGEYTVTKALTEKDIENIMVTALEGGIGYWARLIMDDMFADRPKGEPLSMWCVKLLLTGIGLTFQDAEDDDERWVLSLEKLVKGIQEYADLHDDFDLEDFDADAADAIVQHALFGEVVYC